MKKIHIIIGVVFISLTMTAQEKKMVWDYPVKPGTEEWASFTSSRQMLDACQIPQKILTAISTKDLVEICMNYPLFFEYTASNDERNAISIMIENFNGLKELSKRSDGAKELIQTYKDFPILAQVPQTASKNYDVPYKLPFLELILSNDSFINKLSNDELKELQNIVLNKYSNKVKNASVYSLYNIKKTFLLSAVVIDKQKDKTISAGQKDIVRKFIENYNTTDVNLLTEFSKIISEL